jgi:hypothetical protein
MRVALALVLTAAATRSLSAAAMSPRSGWYVGAGRVHACPGVSAKRCTQVTSWASNLPWRGCTECLPHEMIKHLPSRGIAIQIVLGRETPTVKEPRISWPPRIRRGAIAAGFEGVPRRFGVYQRFVRVGRYSAYVWVFFGRSRPTAAQVRAANAELATARRPR